MNNKILKVKAARARLRRECTRNGWTFNTATTIKEKVRYGKKTSFILDKENVLIKKGTLLEMLDFMELRTEDEKLQSMSDFNDEKREEYERRRDAKR